LPHGRFERRLPLPPGTYRLTGPPSRLARPTASSLSP
jgi:hypothetical protein